MDNKELIRRAIARGEIIPPSVSQALARANVIRKSKQQQHWTPEIRAQHAEIMRANWAKRKRKTGSGKNPPPAKNPENSPKTGNPPC